MRWEDREESRNVDDRRNAGKPNKGGLRGMPSMGTIMFLWPVIQRLLKTKFGWAIIGIGAVAYFAGFNPVSMLSEQSVAPTNEIADDKQKRFIATVLGDTEKVWKPIFKQHGTTYKEPTMVLYRGATNSGCGHASAQMGPFYCPADQKIYIDLGFFDELASKHNASGDFAQAYVLAHEVGHHIQHIQGTLNKVHQMKQQVRGSKGENQLQVRVELQADCYAGVWAHHAHKRFNILEQGDVEEALRAASAIGDDTLQKQAQGYVVPDAFTHGSAEQRVTWFRKGIKSGDINSCDTGI
ncbi:MAG: YpfJ protein, zinc metalloprotease superfamily [uncultured Sulfurovum sp.]|uniref:YpfJ protein, zinc metalloprotease superfamily n=1 Tax=uncultured Sulfurovum sp. TaxID=269237 RepID=A0A6S6TDN9_9BACT|nr:MAG: YpfJ protein, zinc metalloprotease superfamily [uncultured Sulfurovum sp.]